MVQSWFQKLITNQGCNIDGNLLVEIAICNFDLFYSVLLYMASMLMGYMHLFPFLSRIFGQNTNSLPVRRENHFWIAISKVSLFNQVSQVKRVDRIFTPGLLPLSSSILPKLMSIPMSIGRTNLNINVNVKFKEADLVDHQIWNDLIIALDRPSPCALGDRTVSLVNRASTNLKNNEHPMIYMRGFNMDDLVSTIQLLEYQTEVRRCRFVT